jgi:hypothetical protein
MQAKQGITKQEDVQTLQYKLVHNFITIHIQIVPYFLFSFRLFAEGNYLHFKNVALLTTALNKNLFLKNYPSVTITNLFTKSSV